MSYVIDRVKIYSEDNDDVICCEDEMCRVLKMRCKKDECELTVAVDLYDFWKWLVKSNKNDFFYESVIFMWYEFAFSKLSTKFQACLRSLIFI